jgi:diguanylate cyclase (GGDEF)-like protein
VVCGLLALAYPLALHPGPTVVLSASAGAAAAALAVLAQATRRTPIAPAQGHALAAVVLLAPTTHAALALGLTGEPDQTGWFALLLVAAALALPDRRWFAVSSAAVWTAWTAAAIAGGLQGRAAATTLTLLTAAALAAVVNVTRRHALTTIETLRRGAEAAAVRDADTGVANRSGLALQVAPMFEGSRRRGDALHAHAVAVHRLDEVTAVLGHEVAAEVLVAVAEGLRATVRGTDVVSRTESCFVVVGPGAGIAAEELERRVRDWLAAHPPVDPRSWSGRVAVGSAVLAPWDNGSLESLIEKAEAQLRGRTRRPRTAPLVP